MVETVKAEVCHDIDRPQGELDVIADAAEPGAERQDDSID